ncbi:MAG: hypothetical protein NUV80_00980 [Candidatus Berkelbacteria bacterium]|nr:hypothetical protein [Candidatus Berkelbacteria bacterium]
MSLAKLGKKGQEASGWKGDRVQYNTIHIWIRSMLGKPDTCENCGQSGLQGHQINWANKSREYKRTLTDWLRLCVKCHRAYDMGLVTI